MPTSPFSPLCKHAEDKLRQVLINKRIDPNIVTRLVWSGNVVHLFSHQPVPQPFLTVRVSLLS